MTDLVVDWCSYKAAKFAVKHWHYSGVMPPGKTVKIGAWEDGKFIGVIVYSFGANNHIGNPYGLQQTEVCELTRVALREHNAPVSEIVTKAKKKLVKQSPGIRLIVSYADPEKDHNGAIYQAMNWIYVGSSDAQREVIVNGKVMHKRSAFAKFGTVKGLEPSREFWKHKYIYPLDRAMRRQIAPLAQPYPKASGRSIEGDTSGVQPEGAGSTPAVRS